MAAQVFESAIGTGVAVLTMAHRIFIVNNYKEPKTRLLAEIPGTILILMLLSQLPTQEWSPKFCIVNNR